MSSLATVEKFPDELQLFDPPVTQSIVESSYSQEILPLNQIVNNTDVIEFLIPATEHYLDLSDVLLYMRCQILGTDKSKPLGVIKSNVRSTVAVQQATPSAGTPALPAAQPDQSTSISSAPPVSNTPQQDKYDYTLNYLNDPQIASAMAALTPQEREQLTARLGVQAIRDAAPVNLLFYMCFERCEIELNGTPFDTSYNNYGYKGFFNILLNYSRGVKKHLLYNLLWFKDRINPLDPENSMEHIDLTKSANNQGLLARYSITKEGKPFELLGRIMHELFSLENYLLPNVSVKIRLFKRNPSFFLLSNDQYPDYYLNILDMRLLTRFVKILPKTHEQIMKRLGTKPAIYKIYSATDIRTRSLPAGQRHYTFDNFFASEKIPNRIIFAMVTHDAYLGSYRKNPLNFQHFNLEEITLAVDNLVHTYKVDFKNGNYAMLYTALACQLGNRDMVCSSDTSYLDLRYGTSIYPFDLTPNHNFDDIPIERKQLARLELKFSKPLSEPIELLIFSEYPRIFQVDKHKKFTVLL